MRKRFGGVWHDRKFAEQLFHAIRVILMCGDGKEAFRNVKQFFYVGSFKIDAPEFTGGIDYRKKTSPGFEEFMEGYVR